MIAAAIPSGARADEAATQREAQARFEEGIARVKAGNLEAARISFTQAYALLEKPTILWNLALTDEKTGHVLEALEHFKLFARGPQGDDDRANAQKHITLLMAQTAHLAVSAPAGVDVIVDGNPAGMAPLSAPVDVLPGPHHVEAPAAKGAREVDVDAGPGQVVAVSLMPAGEIVRPAAPMPIREEVPARLPDDARGAEPAEGGGSSTARVATVALLGTTAAVSVGLGAYFAVQSRNNEHTAEGFRAQFTSPSYCSHITADVAATCSEWNDAVKAQGRDATLSDAMYIAGGVFVVGALATWLFWPSESKEGKAVALVPAPILGPTGAGLGAVGRF